MSIASSTGATLAFCGLLACGCTVGGKSLSLGDEARPVLRMAPPAVASLQQPTGPRTAALPTAAAPDAETATETAAADGPVPISIDEAIQLALANSFGLARIDRFAAQSDLRLKISRAQYWPRIDISANANQSERYFESETPEFSGTTPFEPAFFGSLFVFANKPIDVFGQIGRQVEQALLSQRDSALQQRQVVLDLTSSVRLAYLEALRGDAGAAALRATLGELQRLRAAAGARAPAAVPLIDSEIAAAGQSLEAAEAGIDVAQAPLKDLLRIPEDVDLRLTSGLPTALPAIDYATLEETALANRPELRSAEIRLRQAENSMKQIADFRKPTVYVSGFYNYAITGEYPEDARDRRFESVSIGLNVNVPLALFDGGSLSAQRQIAALTVEQAEADLLEQQERVRLEVDRELAAVRAAEALAQPTTVAGLRQALDAAEAALLAAPPARAPALMAEVSAARESLRQAESAPLSGLLDYWIAYYQLLRSLGASEA